MTNLLMTSRCVRSCPYCFAKREMAGSPSGDIVNWENLIYLADFLMASGQDRLSLLGGEPTLHPQFVDMVCFLIERNFHVTVFTSGIMADKRLRELADHLSSVPPGRLSFVVNLNNPAQTPAPKQESRRIAKFLSLMGPWCTPGFNIYRTDFDIEFLFDLIARYGMNRHIRLGLASPMPGMESLYIKPDEVRTVINRLYSFRPALDRFDIKPGLDCGFPLCGFTNEQLGWLIRHSGKFKFGCGPAIDLTPDLNVYACFPLSGFHKRSLFEFNSMKEIHDFYQGLFNRVRSETAGIYEECDGCIHREEGRCSGGGVCQVMNRFVGEAPIRLMEIERGLSKPCVAV
jgi:hypothetical protein